MFLSDNARRLKIQNDIVKDVAVILGNQSDKMNDIEEFLNNEVVFEELEYLREAQKIAYRA